jgi:hypothetical protein
MGFGSLHRFEHFAEEKFMKSTQVQKKQIGMAAFLLCCFLGTVCTAKAQVQTVTAVSGAVTDSQGASVPGADVTLINEDTGSVQKTKSNGSGAYSFQSIRPGTYTLRATYAGFKTAEVVHRVARVAEPAAVDFTLETGQIAETVTVSAVGADLLNTTTSEVSGTIGRQLVDSLPLNGRNFLDLATQVPGTNDTGATGSWVPNGQAQQSFTQSSLMGVRAAGLIVTAGVYLGGNRDTASNISIDGSNVQMAIYGQVAQLQSPADIEEVKVESGVMNPEFGFGTGAVNTITRSGTNQLHGEVYEYLRNKSLDANDYFANLFGQPKAPYQMNQFGAAVGGPILKNKLHFFGNYEGLRVNQKTVVSGNTPPASVRNGDFSDLGNGQTPPTIYNPYKFDPVTGLRQPFPGNKIPMGNTDLCSPRPTCVDPVTVAYLKYSPLPNKIVDGIPEYVAETPTTIKQNQYTGRIDWDKSEKTHFFSRFTYFDDKSVSTNLAPIAGIENPYGNINPTVSWVQTITANAVNDLTLGFSRAHFANSRATDGIGNVAQELGLKNTSSNPGGPDMNLQGSGGYHVVGSNYSLSSDLEDNLQLKDDFGLVHGKHAFKVGFQWNNRRVHFDSDTGDKGQLYYNPVFSAACPSGNETCAGAQQGSGLDSGGMSFADYLMGTNVNVQLVLPAARYNANQSYYGAYVQDTWRISPKLTLNAGLRYDHWTPWLEVNRIAVRWNGAAGNVVFALRNPLDYLNPATDYGKNAPLNPGVPGSGYTTGDKGFAPRLGLAYLLTPNTSLRGGAGIYFDGNPNLNQFSYIQSHANPFGLFLNTTVAPNQQLPTLFTSEQFPPPAPGAIAAPSETNPLSIAAIAGANYPTPTVYQWTASLQQKIGNDWAFELTYLGSHTIREMQYMNLNPANLPVGDLANVPLQQRRVHTDWGSIATWAPAGFAKYNAMIASVKTPRWRGLTLSSWFSWSNDYVSGQLGQSDIGNTDYRHYAYWGGRSLINPSVRQVNSWNYELPIGRNKLYQPGKVVESIAGDWQFSGTAQFSQGGHQAVWLDQDNTGTEQYYAMPNQVPNCNPNKVPGGRSRLQWFNTACYTTPAFGVFGNSHIGSMVMPGVENLDIALQKSFVLPRVESNQLQFRADFFNALNHTQWGFVDNGVTDTQYGRVESTHDPRRIQFSLKYLF